MLSEFETKIDCYIFQERLEMYFMSDNRKLVVLLMVIGLDAFKVLHDLCDPVSPSQRPYVDLCGML